MKTFFSLSPVILAFIVLAAHLLRDGDLLPMLVCLAFPFLLLVRQPWVVWAMRIALLLGAAQWIVIAFAFVRERQSLGQSWDRLAIILGVVALLTAASALVFQLSILKARYSPLSTNH